MAEDNQSIRRMTTILITSHRTEAPVVVVVDAKGSGKTLAFLQMCRRGTWEEFANAVGVGAVTLDARLVPVRRSDILMSLKEHRDIFGNPADDISWRKLWLMVMARSIGVQTMPDKVEHTLADVASEQRMVFLIDGLEDLFQDFTEDLSQQRALRVLLTDCLDWMRSLRGRPLGLVVFVRLDLVTGAIRQNVQQFRARYQQYELQERTP